MKLTIRPASAETFAAMANWRYEQPYDFYDGDPDPVLNPERFYEALDDNGLLVGNYYFEEKGNALEIGLGIRPDLTGHGLGLEFLRAGIEYGTARFGIGRVILNVAAFNERAIKVYERAGFRETGRHTRQFDRWGDVEFVEMEQAAERG
ncbi:MAG: GNAT family N-acetyltransferase [Gaiellaceae bacterium]